MQTFVKTIIYKMLLGATMCPLNLLQYHQQLWVWWLWPMRHMNFLQQSQEKIIREIVKKISTLRKSLLHMEAPKVTHWPSRALHPEFALIPLVATWLRFIKTRTILKLVLLVALIGTWWGCDFTRGNTCSSFAGDSTGPKVEENRWVAGAWGPSGTRTH